MTNVTVVLISGDKFEFNNVVGLTFDNDLLFVRGQQGDQEITRGVFRKELIKCVLQAAHGVHNA